MIAKPAPEEPGRRRHAPADPPKAADGYAEGKRGPAFSWSSGRSPPTRGASGRDEKSEQSARIASSRAPRAGGVSSDGGEVELRFLVQGRGRAEGVSVQKRRGVSVAAAKCIADVVDRRYVGYPDGPEVGATLVVTMKKK